MPAPAPAEFSFDRDVAAHASRFFDTLGADPSLSPETKLRLQNSLLGGVEGIQAQRLKLQEEADQGRMRKLDYEGGVMALEEARAKRTRLEQQEALLGQQEQRRAEITSTAKDILYADDTVEAKRQALARTALDFADDSDALKTFDLAEKALPKPAITNAERFSAALKGIPQEILDTGDLDLIAEAAAEVDEKKERDAEAKKARNSDDDDAKRIRLELAKAPLKFQKEGDEETGWLEPESTKQATAIVLALGSDAEQKRFEALKGAESDHARADLIEKIQLREQLRVAQAASGSAGTGRKSASSVTGL